MGTRRIFSREYKREAVRLVTQRGVSVAQAARDLDLHENVLRKWVAALRSAPDRAVDACTGAASPPSAVPIP